MAGCVLVDVDCLQVITRSPSYKNRYVHRRSSSCLGLLTETQVTERRRVGLLRCDGDSRTRGNRQRGGGRSHGVEVNELAQKLTNVNMALVEEEEEADDDGDEEGEGEEGDSSWFESEVEEEDVEEEEEQDENRAAMANRRQLPERVTNVFAEIFLS